MARTDHNTPNLHAPTGSTRDDLLKELARLLGRAAARQWIAREHRSAPAAERPSEEKRDD